MKRPKGRKVPPNGPRIRAVYRYRTHFSWLRTVRTPSIVLERSAIPVALGWSAGGVSRELVGRSALEKVHGWWIVKAHSGQTIQKGVLTFGIV
eukprot:1186148-Prorocentrum_minimum.AAC.4